MELTQREQQIMRMICNGAENTEIADSMGKGLGTIRINVSEILRKLGAKNRTQAAVLWTRAQLTGAGKIG